MKRRKTLRNRPKSVNIDSTEYLYRLNLTKKEPSLEYLKELQKAHLLNIPFENLDIHYKNKIILDYDRIFKKIVTNKRGGFCYELNGLFYYLLCDLGFDCYVISGRVWNKEKEAFGKPYDHMALVVCLEEIEWLVDVGFGDGIINPLKIEAGQPQIDYTRYWRIDKDPDENLILKVSDDNSYYQSKLLFTLEEKQLIQFLEMCDYHQTSNESPFTQKKLITKLTENGRITLTDRALIVQEMGQRIETPMLHEDDFLSKLEQHFKITYDQLLPREQ